ncbi:Hypothetical predicted protein [Cloeon dipterum]|uniref:Uncharacterized protein n=1 Tax=Cloeon dipterum TaxID=197152 RepID=A0A8S1CW33_9INSE|nr:Hypothetical predicted protein [Cloeon dipterum]
MAALELILGSPPALTPKAAKAGELSRSCEQLNLANTRLGLHEAPGELSEKHALVVCERWSNVLRKSRVFCSRTGSCDSAEGPSPQGPSGHSHCVGRGARRLARDAENAGNACRWVSEN